MNNWFDKHIFFDTVAFGQIVAALFAAVISIISLNKDFRAKTKAQQRDAKIIRAVIIVLTLLSISNIFVSGYSSHSDKKNLNDSLTVLRKSSEKTITKIQRQNDSLKKQLKDISIDNHSLIGSVKSFRTTFKENVEKQDSIFEFITGGENLPLAAAIFSEANSYLKTQNEIHVWIENYGKTPLRDVNYIIRNSYMDKVLDERVPTLAFQRSLDVYKFIIPDDLDSCQIGGTLIWPGIKLRAYNFFININRKPDGGFKTRTFYEHIGGGEFDPFKTKGLYFPKAKVLRRKN